MNYREIIDKGVSVLKKNLILSAKTDSELLLSISLKKSRENILLNLDKKLNYQQIKQYIELVNRRKKKEPISLIVGKRSFWKSEFYVNKNVLTPRFETELLVEEVLKIYKFSEYKKILDIGVGSGCILVSILKEKSKWHGVGMDISGSAIKIAKTNAKIQQVSNRIKFIKSDIDNITVNKYDLVVSNPPYINKIGYNNLDFGVKSFEPQKALYGGIDGLRIIEKVIEKSKIVLKISGLLAMEIGLGQSFNVCRLLKENGFYIYKITKDYQKIRRCIFAKKVK